ncbi:MAG: phosphatase PAP2 family protein, partial [Dehalococcoidia bacterium]
SLIGYIAMPTAPPRMFPELGYVDTVRDHSSVYQQFEGSDLVNEFAAVPSFHFGWILLVGLALIQTNRNILMRGLAVTLPLMMLLAILFTANHYWIDAVIGGAIVLGALAIVRALEHVHLPQWRPAASRRLSQ